MIRNRREDFHVWRDGASGIIQKLHSDLEHPHETVVTSADYQRLYVDNQGNFRDALCRVFSTFDVFIIGHSLSDPDIDFILRLARSQRSPQHPIFMVAAGYTKADEQEFLEKYNIVLVQYANPDGSHSELRRLLKVVDHFVAPRGDEVDSPAIVQSGEGETAAAVAIFLYRRLQSVRPKEYLSPVVLLALCQDPNGRLPALRIPSLPAIANLTKNRASHVQAIDSAVRHLIDERLAEDDNGTIAITSAGRTKVLEYHSLRQLELQQAYDGFLQYLADSVGHELEPSRLDHCKSLAEAVIVQCFSNRASMIANKVFSDHSARPDELSDIFGYVTKQAVRISDVDLRASFIAAMRHFLVNPNPAQRKYLASVSQGYFLYHLLGLDPNCGEARRTIFRRTLWICDSSVILPWIAKGCYNHQYARELFRLLTEEHALLCTTPRLLQEAWEHLEWARLFVERFGVNSLEFLRAASVKGSYKQNLFLDGFIRLRADGTIGTFQDYLKLIVPKKLLDQEALEESIGRSGIKVVNISRLSGFVQDDWGDIEEAKIMIRTRREEIGTYRSPLQVESEAEVSVLLTNLRLGRYSIENLETADRFYFVSQSRIIDQVFQVDNLTTWTPESLFRYLSALPGRDLDPDLLQQCMLHEYFYAGISFIDRARYERYFGPAVDLAKASFDREVAGYIEDVEDRFGRSISDSFGDIPDLDKPFFIEQMGWKKADAALQREEVARDRVEGLEREVEQLRSERKGAAMARTRRRRAEEAARRRNLLDPKHVRKRRRQAKKRRKKSS